MTPLMTPKTDTAGRTQFLEERVFGTYDVDLCRRATPAGIMRLLQDAASHQMAAQKPAYDELLDGGKALMLSTIDLAIHEPPVMNQRVVVSSWPCESARATFNRCYAMWNEDGQLIAEASSKWVLADVETRRLLKYSDVDFSNYYFGDFREALDGSRFRISKEETAAMRTAAVKTVCLSDCDYNGHMNNTYSLDFVCDYVPELADGSARVAAVRLHFVNEAPLGDELTLMRVRTEDGRYLFQSVKKDGRINIEAEIRLR